MAVLTMDDDACITDYSGNLLEDIPRTLSDPSDLAYYRRMSSQDSPLLSPIPKDKLRSTRSHSLKVFTMKPSFLYQRSKRTLSLPCTPRPIFPPTIQIEQSRFVDEDIIEENGNKPVAVEDTLSSFTAVMGLSCSLFLFAWSCLLSNFSRT